MSGINTELEKLLQSRGAGSNSGVWGSIENVFDSVGLMRGAWTPIGRFAVCFVGGWLLIKAVNPSFAYDETGEPLVWAYSQDAAHLDPSQTTKIPWWMIPSLFGIWAGLFV